MRPFRETITEQDARKEKKNFTLWLKARAADLGRWFFLLVCAVASGWLMYQSYPGVSRHELAWFALAPFIWGVTKTKGFWSSFFYGWLTAFLGLAGIFYCSYYTLKVLKFQGSSQNFRTFLDDYILLSTG